MSEASNVERARQAYGALTRRDLEDFLTFMDASVEAVPRVAVIEGGYHGHDGLQRWWKHLAEFLPDILLESGEVRALGDFTITAGRMSGHAAGSSTPVNEPLWTAAQWRDGKCVWWGTFDTEAQALEAVRARG